MRFIIVQKKVVVLELKHQTKSSCNLIEL